MRKLIIAAILVANCLHASPPDWRMECFNAAEAAFRKSDVETAALTESFDPSTTSFYTTILLPLAEDRQKMIRLAFIKMLESFPDRIQWEQTAYVWADSFLSTKLEKNLALGDPLFAALHDDYESKRQALRAASATQALVNQIRGAHQDAVYKIENELLQSIKRISRDAQRFHDRSPAQP
jgi:hypothetical protein